MDSRFRGNDVILFRGNSEILAFPTGSHVWGSDISVMSFMKLEKPSRVGGLMFLVVVPSSLLCNINNNYTSLPAAHTE